MDNFCHTHTHVRRPIYIIYIIMLMHGMSHWKTCIACTNSQTNFVHSEVWGQFSASRLP